MSDQIASMLSKGLSQVEVANAVGCSESYISQLMSDGDFKAKVNALKAARYGTHEELDGLYDTVELLAMKRLHELAETKVFLTPDNLFKLATMSNAAKRKTGMAASNSPGAGATIIINLPSGLIPGLTVIKSRQNEVLEVNGQTLLPMDTRTLLAKNAARQAEIDIKFNALEAAVSEALGVTQELVQPRYLTDKLKARNADKAIYIDDCTPLLTAADF